MYSIPHLPASSTALLQFWQGFSAAEKSYNSVANFYIKKKAYRHACAAAFCGPGIHTLFVMPFGLITPWQIYSSKTDRSALK
jgi:hypothetical protein